MFSSLKCQDKNGNCKENQSRTYFLSIVCIEHMDSKAKKFSRKKAAKIKNNKANRINVYVSKLSTSIYRYALPQRVRRMHWRPQCTVVPNAQNLPKIS